MKTFVCASALLAIAGASQGAAFSNNTFSAGVLPGDLGAPITWTHPTNAAAFNPGAGALFAPAPDSMDLSANLRADSYLGMDPLGPSDAGNLSSSGDGYQSNNSLGTTSANVGFAATGGNGQIQGGWFSTGFVPSGQNPAFAGADTMFVARISLRAGSSAPTTAGFLANIQDSGTAGQGVLGALRFGSANASNNGGLWGQAYYLDFVTSPISGLTGAANTPFNGGTSYDIFVVAAIPTPGAAGLAGIAGLVAARRRRA